MAENFENRKSRKKIVKAKNYEKIIEARNAYPSKFIIPLEL